MRYRSQVANLQVAVRSLDAALRDATSGVLAGVAEAFAGRSTTLLCSDLSNAEMELNGLEQQLIENVKFDALKDAVSEWTGVLRRALEAGR